MNKSKLYTCLLILIAAAGINGFTNAQNITVDPVKTISKVNAAVPKTTGEIADNKGKVYEYVLPLAVVASPKTYLGKNIKFKAKFDKFATLGLDYNPAFRSSEKYISFLIQRDDVKEHDIPLSELKIFITRTEAEKHIDLNSGDEIEVCGRVFSTALGDAWMDVDKFTVLKTTPKTAGK